MIFGHELLGAAKFKKKAIKLLPDGRAGKVFMNEFGNALPVIVGWAKKGTHPIIAAQGVWQGNHNYSGNGDLKLAIKECKRLNEVAKDYPHLTFHYSPFCEHRLPGGYMVKVFNELAEHASNLVLVNNPMQGGALVKGYYNEIHGSFNPNNIPAPYDWACDGLSAVDCDIEIFKARHKQAKVIWMWIPQYNCKKRTHESTPINQRKVKPTKKQIISVDYLCFEKAKADLNKKWLYKTHADQHYDKPAPREGKPVVICDQSANLIDMVAANGKVIHRIKRAGNFTDGRPLYRAGKWGYELQEKAAKVSGSKSVELKIGKKSYGFIDPAFRENAWRNK